jgi:iron complex outermembrane receptor protein
MYIKERFADHGAIGSAMAQDPTKPVYDENSAYGGYFYWKQTSSTAPITSQATWNPVAQLYQRDDRSNVNRLLGNVQVEYLAHFLPDLKATLNLGGDFSKSEGNVNASDNSAGTYDPVYGGGINNYYAQHKRNTLLDFYLNYKKEIPSIKSRIDVTGGYEWQHFYRNDTANNANASGSKVTYSDYNATESYLISFFGRLNYILADKYYLTVTVRDDGSSRFAKENRWGLFPSLALAWDIKGESFVKNVSLISALKLRLGYGVTGQQEIGQGDYPYLARYTSGLSSAQYQMGNNWITTLRPEGYDKNLKWEETTTYNIGLDFGLLKERISGAIDAYYRPTKDMLNTIPVPAGTNLTNQILTNVGNMVNKGIEFSLNVRPIVKPDMQWTISLNGTYNKNEITKLTTVDDPDYQGVVVGGIAGGVGNYIQINTVGYPRNSYYVYQQIYDAAGNPIEGLYADRNGDGSVTELDKYRIKKPEPDVFMGLSSTFNYKNLDFSFNSRLNIGNFVYNNMSSNHSSYSEVYRSVGSLANVNRSILKTNFENPQYWSDYYLENASFFRMDNMSLGYSFTDLVNGKGRIRVYASVQNVFVITKYTGLDPEVFDGIDNNIFPRPRTYLFGVSLEF